MTALKKALWTFPQAAAAGASALVVATVASIPNNLPELLIGTTMGVGFGALIMALMFKPRQGNVRQPTRETWRRCVPLAVGTSAMALFAVLAGNQAPTGHFGVGSFAAGAAAGMVTGFLVGAAVAYHNASSDRA